MIFCVFKEKEKNNAFQGTEIAITADGNIPLAFLLIFLLVILSSEESNLIAPPQTNIGLSRNIGRLYFVL